MAVQVAKAKVLSDVLHLLRHANPIPHLASSRCHRWQHLWDQSAEFNILDTKARIFEHISTPPSCSIEMIVLDISVSPELTHKFPALDDKNFVTAPVSHLTAVGAAKSQMRRTRQGKEPTQQRRPRLMSSVIFVEFITDITILSVMRFHTSIACPILEFRHITHLISQTLRGHKKKRQQKWSSNPTALRKRWKFSSRKSATNATPRCWTVKSSVAASIKKRLSFWYLNSRENLERSMSSDSPWSIDLFVRKPGFKGMKHWELQKGEDWMMKGQIRLGKQDIYWRGVAWCVKIRVNLCKEENQRLLPSICASQPP